MRPKEEDEASYTFLPASPWNLFFKA
jgi:hypothetical protein